MTDISRDEWKDLKSDLNGFGRRVNNMERIQENHEVRMGAIEKELPSLSRKIDGVVYKLAFLSGIMVIGAMVVDKMWK